MQLPPITYIILYGHCPNIRSYAGFVLNAVNSDSKHFFIIEVEIIKVNKQIYQKIMRKVAFHNLGCKVNSYETDIMRKNLLSNGYSVVPFDQKADVYVVNTCSVTNIADRKSRQLLHRAKKLNPNAVIVAAGCYVDTRSKNSVLEEGVDIAVLNSEKEELFHILDAYFDKKGSEAEKCGEDLFQREIIGEGHLSGDVHLHTRAFIKCQDGCNMFCTYCIIPYARGRIKSRNIRDICEEVRRLSSEEGFKEFVLTGIHICSYGIDRKEEGETLAELIRAVSETEGVERIRLSSLEPKAVDEGFISKISGIDKLCPHFHMSLQSGSDTVLKRMNRRYDTEDFKSRVLALREAFFDPAITTDIIVGFPGESEEEFEETVRFVEDIGFYETHIFKYSRRKGTPADRMDGQLTEKVKAERSSRLLLMNNENKRRFIDRHMKKESELLLEEELSIGSNKYLTGYTGEYIKAAVEAGDFESGQIIKGYPDGFIDDETVLFIPE